MVVRLSVLPTGCFYPRKCSWYSFLLEAESTPRAIMRLEGLCQWKIPVTPSGIEPATFWFVAQHFNHCATAKLLYLCEYTADMQKRFSSTHHNLQFSGKNVSTVCITVRYPSFFRRILKKFTPYSKINTVCTSPAAAIFCNCNYSWTKSINYVLP